MKKVSLSILMGVLSALLAFFSCATSEEMTSELDGEWEVVTVVMDSAIVDLNGLSADVDPYFGFDMGESRFYGNSAYNSLSGDLSADSLESGRLAIYHIATTMMASPTMNLEQSIVDNLEKVKRYETFGIPADTMEFYDENGKTLFTLARRAPYSRLMGKWQFVEIKGKHIEPPAVDNIPYVVFDINHNIKMIFGYTGCNAFNGSLRLEVGNSKIYFGEIAVSSQYCEDIPWENDLLSVFREAHHYAISDDEIDIFDAKGDEIAKLRKMR